MAQNRLIDRPPPDYADSATPVTIGVVDFVNGQETPDGHGILAWSDAGTFYCAILDSPEQFVVDGIVSTAGQRRTILAGSVTVGSVWVWAGVLYAFVSVMQEGDSYTTVLQANDPNDPVSWSEIGRFNEVTSFDVRG